MYSHKLHYLFILFDELELNQFLLLVTYLQLLVFNLILILDIHRCCLRFSLLDILRMMWIFFIMGCRRRCELHVFSCLCLFFFVIFISFFICFCFVVFCHLSIGVEYSFIRKHFVSIFLKLVFFSMTIMIFSILRASNQF